jgi:hypothetical protein
MKAIRKERGTPKNTVSVLNFTMDGDPQSLKIQYRRRGAIHFFSPVPLLNEAVEERKIVEAVYKYHSEDESLPDYERKLIDEAVSRYDFVPYIEEYEEEAMNEYQHRLRKLDERIKSIQAVMNTVVSGKYEQSKGLIATVIHEIIPEHLESDLS